MQLSLSPNIEIILKGNILLHCLREVVKKQQFKEINNNGNSNNNSHRHTRGVGVYKETDVRRNSQCFYEYLLCSWHFHIPQLILLTGMCYYSHFIAVK